MKPISVMVCGDVVKVLKQLDEDSVDVIITSPPYNIGYASQKQLGSDLKGHLYGDDNKDFMDEAQYQAWMIEVLNELYRIIKPTGSLFFNHKDRTKITVRNDSGNLVKKTQVFVSPMDFISQTQWKVKQRLIWNRRTTHQQNPHMFTPIHEDVYWLVKNPRKVVKNRITMPTVFETQREGRKLHPAPFPVELPKRLIECVAPDEATVLDPFVGSGSTLVAATELGYWSVGIDIVERYIEMSAERVREQGGEPFILGLEDL